MSEHFVTSEVVAALEALWGAIRTRPADLPRCVFVVASGTEGQRFARWGHWAPVRWAVEDGDQVAEVLVSGERLAHGAEGALETTLHEAAHALAFARKIKDTSRGGRYHNGRFAALAVALGLVVFKDARSGCRTDLGDETAAMYVDQVAALDVAIRGAYRRDVTGARLGDDSADGDDDPADGDDGVGPDGKTGGRRALLLCSCEEPRRLRVSRSVAEAGPILCGLCGSPFEVS